jgi:hypothetical protein
MAGRVQVAPLDAPERLQPSGIQSDTFAQAAPPAVNNNLERLSQALGGFASTLNAVGRHQEALGKKRQAELEKRQLDGMNDAYWKWRLTATDNTLVKEAEAGRVPYMAEPRMDAIFGKDYGESQARIFANQLEDAMKGPDGQSSLSPDYDPAQYVRNKAAEFVANGRFRHTPWATRTFATAVEAIEKSVVERHRQMVGQRVVQAGETAAYNRFEARFKNAVALGLSPEDTTAYLREEYQQLGPRVKGGALDMQYSRLDEIKLEVLEKMATAGPAEAKLAATLLQTKRVDPETGEKLDSLADNPRLMDKVEQIRRKATHTLATAEKTQFEAAVRQAAAAAALREDGTLSIVQPIERDFAPGVSSKKSREELQKTATADALMAIRAENGGREDLPREIQHVARNNVEHPTLIPELNAEASSALTLIQTKGQEAEGVSRFIRSASRYMQMADTNMIYTKSQIKGVNADIYETYTALVRGGKMDEQTAANHVLRIYAQASYDEIRQADSGRRLEVDKAAQGINFNRWGFGGSEGAMFGQAITNGGEVRQEVVKLATVLMRAQGMIPDDAIKVAAARIEQQGLFINGRVVFGVNGLNKEDTPAVHGLIEKMFTEYSESFKRAGITDPSQATILPFPNGTMQIVHKDTLQLVYPKLPSNSEPWDGEETSDRPLTLTSQQVQRARGLFKEAQDKFARDRLLSPKAFNQSGSSKGRNAPPGVGSEGDIFAPIDR